MRQLRLMFAQTDRLTKVLVAATILPLAGSCGGQSDSTGNGQAVASGGAAISMGGATNAVGGGSRGGNASSGGASDCPSYASTQTFIVELPGGATPASAAGVCNWPGAFAVDRPAARVTLKYDASALNHATGVVTVDPDILNAAGGFVGISSVVASGATVSNLVRSGDGYTFDVSFAVAPYLSSSMTFQVTLDFTCAPQMSSTRTLLAATTLTLCGSYDNLNWVSSGDTCAICHPMAEMAAQLMPAPPGEPDGIALPGEIDVNIVAVAREDRNLVLMANSPQRAEGLILTWQASAGELMLAADDVAVWILPDEPGPHLVQVAAESGPSASIASYLCRDEA